MKKTSTTVSSLPFTPTSCKILSSSVIHVLIKYAVYLDAQVEGAQYHPANATWPSLDVMRTMPFDYTIHDPKYDDISTVYCPGFKPTAEGRHS